jgi:Putative beta-barrel porin-2, OmpL-like. bbp2
MKQIVQVLSATILVSIALAGEPTASPTPVPRFKISGWIDSGITFNPASPQDNQNFGRFFDDRANEPLLNQAVINLERALAPEPSEFDWGFKLQFMYGSDARFIHSLGLFSDTAATSIRPTRFGRSISQPSLSHCQRGRSRLEAWQIRHPGRSGNDRSAHELLLFAHLHL